MTMDSAGLTQGSDKQNSDVQVTVIVVTWNSASLLEEFVSSLRAAMAGLESWRLVAVDNASGDDSPSVLRDLMPEAVVVELGHNAGYAAGINAGVRAADPSKAYLLLNPDIRLRPGSVETMLTTLSEPNTGIVVPRLVDTSGRLHFSLRREPTAIRALGDAVLGGHRAGKYRLLGEMITDASVYELAGTHDWATGAAMLVSAECWASIGQWDETFFLYSEETEFALRARDSGLRLRYRPDAEAVHIGGDAQISPRLYSILTANRTLLYRRRHGAVNSMMFRSAVILNELIRARGAVHRSALTTLADPSRRAQLIGPQGAQGPAARTDRATMAPASSARARPAEKP
jgi:GT2 family glycosyltransferase